MFLSNAQPLRAFLTVLITWAGDVKDALEQIASIWQPNGSVVGKRAFPDDDAGLTGDDYPTLSRTIRWGDGRDVTLHWRLPSPGR